MNWGTENDMLLAKYKKVVKTLQQIEILQSTMDYLEDSGMVIDDEVFDAFRTLHSSIDDIYSNTNKSGNKILKRLKLIK